MNDMEHMSDSEKAKAVGSLLSAVRRMVDQCDFSNAVTKEEVDTALAVVEVAVLRWQIDTQQAGD